MKSLTEDIKTQSFKNAYLLYGEETYLLRQYAKMLQNALVSPDDKINLSKMEGKSTDVNQLIGTAQTMPFFAEHRCIVVSDSGFFKKSSEELAAYIEEIPESTVLLFLEQDVDKRSKLFKQVQKWGRVVEFGRQKEAVLMKWALARLQKEQKKITRSVMELFLSKTGNDMEVIDRELEKLLCYTMDKEVIEAEDVEAICANQVSGKIFAMVDAIAAKQQKKALELYYELLLMRERPMYILASLSRQFRTLLHLKELSQNGFDYKYMAECERIPEFAVRKYMGQARQFTKKELHAAVEDCAKAQESFVSGKMEEQLAVELLLVKYSAA